MAEPTADELMILKGLKSRFEDTMIVKYADKALRAVDLSARYINDRHLPDKAIDVIDEAGAVSGCCRRPSARRSSTSPTLKPSSPRSPASRLKPCPHPTRTYYAIWIGTWKLVVFGQDEAIGHLATSIKMARAGRATNRNRLAASCSPDPPGWVKLKRPGNWRG